MSRHQSLKERREKILANVLANRGVPLPKAANSNIGPTEPDPSSKGHTLSVAGPAIHAAKRTERQHLKPEAKKAEEPTTPTHQSTRTVLERFVGPRAPGRPPRKADSAETQPSPTKSADSPATSRSAAGTTTTIGAKLPDASPQPPASAASVKIDSSLINIHTPTEQQRHWTVRRLNFLISQKPTSPEPYMSSPFQSDFKTQIISAVKAKTFTKCYYLLQLLNTVNDPSWKKEGTGCFFRSITPRHIEKLQNILNPGLITVINAFQSDDTDKFSQAANGLFEQAQDIIAQAQKKKPLISFRSEKVRKFYEATKNSITQINKGNFVVKQFPVPEIESQNPRSSPKL